MAYSSATGGPTEGTTVTLTRGTSNNRIAIFALTLECGNGSVGALPSSVTCSIGGQSCTALASYTRNIATFDDVGLYIFWCNDATLEAASSGDVTFTLTGGTSIQEQVPYAAVFTGRKQVAPTIAGGNTPESAEGQVLSQSVAASGFNADLLAMAISSGGMGARSNYGADSPTESYYYNDDAGTLFWYGESLSPGTKTASFQHVNSIYGVIAAIIMEAAPTKGRMSLYWSGRGASIASQDFAVDKTTVEAYSSPTYDATAALVGSLGGNHYSATVDPQTRFYNNNNVLLTPEQGCFAAWVRWLEYGTALYSQDADSWPENLAIKINVPGAIQFYFKNGGDGESLLATSDGVASLSTTYFIIARWNSATPYRRLEVYDVNLQRLAYVESSSSWTLPTALGGRVTVGKADGFADSYVDNVFLSPAWDVPVLENAKIDSFAQFEIPGERKTPTQKYTHLLVR